MRFLAHMLLRCDVAEKFLSPCWKAMIQAKRRVKAKKIHQDLGQSEVKGQLLAVSWNGPNNSITEGYESHLRNLGLSPARFTFRCHTGKDPETACHCLGQSHSDCRKRWLSLPSTITFKVCKCPEVMQSIEFIHLIYQLKTRVNPIKPVTRLC